MIVATIISIALSAESSNAQSVGRPDNIRKSAEGQKRICTWSETRQALNRNYTCHTLAEWKRIDANSRSDTYFPEANRFPMSGHR